MKIITNLLFRLFDLVGLTLILVYFFRSDVDTTTLSNTFFAVFIAIGAVAYSSASACDENQKNRKKSLRKMADAFVVCSLYFLLASGLKYAHLNIPNDKEKIKEVLTQPLPSPMLHDKEKLIERAKAYPPPVFMINFFVKATLVLRWLSGLASIVVFSFAILAITGYINQYVNVLIKDFAFGVDVKPDDEDLEK